MRPKLLLWLAPWIALGLGACATTPPPATSKACAEWRWIGIKTQPYDDCPAIPGWKAEPLFASLAAARPAATAPSYGKEARAAMAIPDTKVVQELQRFCVYTKESGGLPSPAAANGKLVRIDQDCAAISVAGGTDPVTDWETYSTHFLAQAGKPETPLEIKNRGGVRLAFLDTHPTGEGVPLKPPANKRSSEHGYSLAHIARNLICSPEDGNVCAAMITTRLALPITRFDSQSRRRTKIDTEHGGHIGLQSDLAEAIRAEVDDWAGNLEKREAPRHLVLNLSVGWDGDLFGGLHENQIAEMQAGTQAVYWALRYAAGYDVLVLAAAGNKSQCATDGPLLPAAWEKEAPRDQLCGEPSGTRIVYAVGGVDSRGERLANARDGGMPPRVAYGASAVVPALIPGQSTAKHTGTSVSTAVASSIAAIVWDTLPDRSSGEIMDILYKSGDDLQRPADFWAAADAASFGPVPAVRRLSLCKALAAACNEPGGMSGCPLKPLSCAALPAVANLDSSSPPLGSCHPWVHTQPPFEPCPVCEPPRISE